ncbi:DUF2142 domain-containing protein [Agreia sp. Leaf335]|uniref:DUF2142 domain-containing protein n=1 Tax=Agreia sp. Leaf335 TaxID=1736340 RepID=UPI0009E9DD4D|nr:DUF2142 domain-containing protein [Agreia sp. Leaf335]
MTSRQAREVVRRPWFVFILSLMAFGAMSVLWAATSPIGASPDEPAHYIKAASVVRGQLIGEPGPRPQDRIVSVPETVANTLNVSCLAFKSDATGDCLPSFGSAKEMVETRTSAGLYNPTYYVLVGWPSLLDSGPSALYFMRFASALVCSLFLATTITFLSQLARPVLPVLAGIVVMTPTTLFLSGSVNPNAFEIVTTGAFFSALLYAVMGRPSRRADWWTAGSLVLSGAMLANSRGLAPAWLGFAVVIVAVSVGVLPFVKRMSRPPFLIAVGLVAVAAGLALVWTLKTNSLPAVGEYPGVGSTFGQGFTTMLSNTVDYLRMAVGVFGWLDSPAPAWVLVLYYVLLTTITAYALVFSRRSRAVAALWVALAACLLMPPLIQASTVTVSGYVWQGRYTLPLIVMLAVMAAVVASNRFSEVPTTDSRRLVVVVLAVTTVAQIASLLTNLKRYVVGSSQDWSVFFEGPRWIPPFFSSTGWFAVCILVAALYLSVALVLTTRSVGLSSRPVEGVAR